MCIISEIRVELHYIWVIADILWSKSGSKKSEMCLGTQEVAMRKTRRTNANISLDALQRLRNDLCWQKVWNHGRRVSISLVARLEIHLTKNGLNALFTRFSSFWIFGYFPNLKMPRIIGNYSEKLVPRMFPALALSSYEVHSVTVILKWHQPTLTR